MISNPSRPSSAVAGLSFKTAAKCHEGCRLGAGELKQQGSKQRKIADALRISKEAVSQGMRRGREGGVEGWIASAATLRLDTEQQARLRGLDVCAEIRS